MIDLYSVPTANGQKASIMLEEVGLPYRYHTLNMMAGEHRQPAFLAINPLGKLPALIDPDPAGGGAPLVVFETAAILLYLAEKTGQLLPSAPRDRAEAYKWLAMVAADLAPVFTGQYIFGTLAKEKVPSVIEYYSAEIARYMQAMEDRLASANYLAGDQYSIADVIAYPHAATSAQRLPTGLTPYPHIRRWADQIGARPAVQRAMKVGVA